MNSIRDHLLQLDEKLTHYWLNTTLTLQQRIEMERHLDKMFGQTIRRTSSNRDERLKL